MYYYCILHIQRHRLRCIFSARALLYSTCVTIKCQMPLVCLIPLVSLSGRYPLLQCWLNWAHWRQQLQHRADILIFLNLTSLFRLHWTLKIKSLFKVSFSRGETGVMSAPRSQIRGEMNRGIVLCILPRLPYPYPLSSFPPHPVVYPLPGFHAVSLSQRSHPSLCTGSHRLSPTSCPLHRTLL